jgi:hypothetical protein
MAMGWRVSLLSPPLENKHAPVLQLCATRHMCVLMKQYVQRNPTRIPFKWM